MPGCRLGWSRGGHPLSLLPQGHPGMPFSRQPGHSGFLEATWVAIRGSNNSRDCGTDCLQPWASPSLWETQATLDKRASARGWRPGQQLSPFLLLHLSEGHSALLFRNLGSQGLGLGRDLGEASSVNFASVRMLFVGPGPGHRARHLLSSANDGAKVNPNHPTLGRACPCHPLLSSLSSNCRHIEAHMQARVKAPTRGCDVCAGK